MITGLGKNQISTLLRASLGSDWIVAVDPDLPYLFEAPDILVGGNGKLLGFFVPRNIELSNPSLLWSRLIMSILALPANFMPVLVLRPSNQIRFTEEKNWGFYNHFAAQLEQHEVLDFTLKMEHKAPNRDLQNLQSKVFSRASDMFELSMAFQADPKWSEPTKDWVDNVHNKMNIAEGMYWKTEINDIHLSKNSQFWMLPNSMIGIVESNNARSQRLRGLFSVSLRQQFTLDNGVPFERSSVAPDMLRFLLTEHIRASRGDPLKDLRAAAFAGWLMPPPSVAEDINEAERFASNMLEDRHD